MLEQDPGSFQLDSAPSDEQSVLNSSSQLNSGADVQDDPDDQVRIEKLYQEEGVGLIMKLLFKAVPDEDVPDTFNIRNWTFCNIYKLPKALHKEWFDTFCKELEALC